MLPMVPLSAARTVSATTAALGQRRALAASAAGVLVVLEPLTRGCHLFELSKAPPPATASGGTASPLAAFVKRLGVCTAEAVAQLSRARGAIIDEVGTDNASAMVTAAGGCNTGSSPLITCCDKVLPTAVTKVDVLVDLDRSTLHLLADDVPIASAPLLQCRPLYFVATFQDVTAAATLTRRRPADHPTIAGAVAGAATPAATGAAEGAAHRRAASGTSHQLFVPVLEAALPSGAPPPRTSAFGCGSTSGPGSPRPL
jgi:hypothetical protein